jgi:hypothetical protein
VEISTASIKELREKSGAGVMDCRAALMECQGDLNKAADLLKEKGVAKAAKKAERVTAHGIAETYVHTGGRVAAMVELNCETDFVARTEEFKKLAHEIAMQVAAMNPTFVLAEQIPPAPSCPRARSSASWSSPSSKTRPRPSRTWLWRSSPARARTSASAVSHVLKSAFTPSNAKGLSFYGPGQI